MMKQKVAKLLTIGMALSPFTSHADSLTRADLITLDQQVVNEIKDDGILGGENNGIRLKALEDRAFRLGAQYGYIERIGHIQAELDRKSDEIDKIYNFTYLMSMSSDNSSEMYLVPPIVKEFSDIKVVDVENKSLTTIENKYVIIKPARLVTTPLDWRQYIQFIPEAERTKIPESLLPQDETEKKVWTKAVNEGWHEGQQIAEREMLTRIEALTEDFRGIILFNRLADQKKLLRPELVKTHVPISGTDSQLIQNKVTYTIVTASKMQLEHRDWTPMVLDNRESMIFPTQYNDINVEVK